MEVISIEDSPVRPPRTGQVKTVPQACVISLSDSDEDPNLSDLPMRRALSDQNSRKSVLSAVTDLKNTKTSSYLGIGMDDIDFSSPLSVSASRRKREQRLDSESVVANIESSSNEELPDITKRSNIRPVAPTMPARISKSETLPITFPMSHVTAITDPIAPVSSHILRNIDSLMQNSASIVATSAPGRTKSKKSLSRSRSTDSETEQDSISMTSSKIAKKKMIGGKSSSTILKAQKKAERENIRLEKAQEKERRLIEKRKAQSIAAVNTLKKTKKDSAPEMLVEMCDSLEGAAIATHFEQFMQSLGCSWTLAPMPVCGLIRLRRKLVAQYDDEKGYWIPLEIPRITDEDQLIVLVKGAEFLRIAASGSSLENHVNSVKRQRPTARVLYLIEGLTALVRKSQAQKNRAYQAAVRAAGIPSDVVSRPKKVRSTESADIDEQAIEDALLDLQVDHQCLIVHSTSPADTAEHLSILISDLSTVPYKVGRTAKSDTFCTENGQIRTGADVRDTFEKILQAIARVTPQIAQAVATKYTSIRDLCTALQRGPQILELIPKGYNVDGTVTGQVLGTATSLKIHKALMSYDAHMYA